MAIKNLVVMQSYIYFWQQNDFNQVRHKIVFIHVSAAKAQTDMGTLGDWNHVYILLGPKEKRARWIVLYGPYLSGYKTGFLAL